jgi:peptidoglycan/xylan/chitin deacetylase (PgdA/CDA1 family)
VTGSGHRVIETAPRQRRAPGTFRSLILCYHAISASWPDPLAVPPERFARQLRGLVKRGYRPLTAPEALSGSVKGFHVTFDDAYRSVVNAVPALEALGATATIFACPRFADSGDPLDVPELAAPLALYPDEMQTMTWPELRALAERGFEIGSHTLSHPHLTRLPDDDLDRELRDSRVHIEDELGRPCRYLAYPFGDDDERVHRAARRAGYETAFTLRPTQTAFAAYAVPRTDLYRGDNALRTLLKTSRLRTPILTALDGARRFRGADG